MTTKRIVIAGGSGFLGTSLADVLRRAGYEVIILTRGKPKNGFWRKWTNSVEDPWSECLEEAEAVINLCGRSVDCRYTQRNKKMIYTSRLEPTVTLGQAIRGCLKPPKVWINASSATIYRHADDRPMAETDGEYGDDFSVDVCKQWEGTFFSYQTSGVRQVALRTGFVLGRNGNPFTPLCRLTRMGLGGRQGSGKQLCSWIHITDFCRAVRFLIEHNHLDGVFNLTAPGVISNETLMHTLRNALHVPFGFELPRWVLEVGAVLIRTETELVLKSRWVVPARLLESGFEFTFPDINTALDDLTTINQQGMAYSTETV